MAKIHMVLQGKGGVAKTTSAVFMAQYFRDRGQEALLIDTDQVNASFKGFKALGVQSLEISKNNEIDPRGWDTMVEKLYKNKNDAIIDIGANTFLPVLSYMLENDFVSLMDEAGHEVFFHIIIAGGESLGHTINSMVNIIEQFADTPTKYVIWLQSFLGPIEQDGKKFFDFDEYKNNEDKIEAIIQMPSYTSGTFGEDIRYMLSNNYTFEEMLSGKYGTSIASMNRYKKIKENLFTMFKASQMFDFSPAAPAKTKGKGDSKKEE